ncbi:MAG: hypothetical protein ACK4YO_01365 [Candidatus Altarchaeaceae archaeon]
MNQEENNQEGLGNIKNEKIGIMKGLTIMIGDAARYLLILFILFLFARLFFPTPIKGLESWLDRYIDVNLFLIIVLILLIVAIILEKKFMPERYKKYAEDKNEEIYEKDYENINVKFSKKEIFEIFLFSLAGFIIIYYLLSIHYPVLPSYFFFLISLQGALLIGFFVYETIKENKIKELRKSAF